MHAFEVGDLGLVARVRERLEPRFDELADPTAQDGLLAEEIGFGLFLERRFEHPCARGTDAFRVREGKLVRLACGVLLDRDQGRGPDAFGVRPADEVAGALRGDHQDVDARGRLDLGEVDVESVREEERLAVSEAGEDLRLVHLLLLRVGQQDHDDVGFVGRLGDRLHGQAGRFRFRARRRPVVEPDAHVDPRVLQVQRVRVPLRAVADDRDLAPFEGREVGVLVVVHGSH